MTIGTLGGGTNWPGASYDPETHIVYAQAANAGVSLARTRRAAEGLLRHPVRGGRRGPAVPHQRGSGLRQRGRRAQAQCEPGEAAAARRPGEAAAPAAPAAPAAGGAPAAPAGGGGGGLNVQGLPIVKPPYGVLSAINLDRGELMWQVPHGDTPDAVRNHPALHGLNIPKTGQQGSVGLMVTKTLVILGDPQVTTTPEHPRGAMLRAYDKQTGEQVGAVWMPAPQSGSPMTYSVDGKQYIVVAVSGGKYSGEYIAFSLPAGSSAN